MTLHMRPLTADEQTKIERLTHAQTVPVRRAIPLFQLVG